jgi:hypothetical protein
MVEHTVYHAIGGSPMPAPVTLAAARALALHAQGLTTPNGSEAAPSREVIYQTIERLGCVQIDTLNKVARAQYLTLWSRLGDYNPADFDSLLFDPADRRLFEALKPIAAIMPFADYVYQMPFFSRPDHANWKQWLADPDNRKTLKLVRERIKKEGALRAGDFEYTGEKRGSWWDWKPAKTACEYLFRKGELMIADRPKFQRMYDLKERVLPDWVDTSKPPRLAESFLYFAQQAVKASGLCRPTTDIKGAYLFGLRGSFKPALTELIKKGVFQTVQVETFSGESVEMVIHQDNLPLLERALDGDLPAGRTTFINFFDSLLWPRYRDRDLWGMEVMIEAYTPAPKRKWGYFCLPILHHDKLVGRFDPTLDRQTGTLVIHALYLENGAQPDEELIAGVASAMRDFMKFHKATDLVIEKSVPEAFGKKLGKAVISG